MTATRTLLAALLCTLAIPQSPSTGNAAISGLAVDAVSNRPLPGALINIWRDPHVPSLPSAITRDDGSFSLSGLPAGAYRLSISKPGYLSGGWGLARPSGQAQVLRLVEGPEPRRVVMKAWPAATIEGRVFDDAGQPVAALTVRLLRRLDESMLGAYEVVSRSTVTNDLGEYSVTGLYPGDYVPVVGCSAQTRSLASGTPPRGSAGGRGGMSPAFADGNLKHLIDQRGQLVVIPSCPPVSPQTFVTSVAGGRSLRDAPRIGLAAGETRANVDIRLRALPAYRVSGTIAKETGPVEGVVLRLVPEDWDGPPSLAELMATATSNGEFTFLMVPPGQYKLMATRRLPPMTPVRVVAGGGITVPMEDGISSDKESLSLKAAVTVGSADVTNLTLTLTAGTRVTGTVRFEGDGEPPIVAGRMSPLFEPLMDRMGLVPATVDAEGRFTVRLAQGTYLIDISRGSVPAWTYKGATLRGRDIGGHPIDVGVEEINDLVLTFTDRVASLSGAVSGERGLSAVVVFPADREDWMFAPRIGGRRAPWRSDMQLVRDGKYRFGRLLPGDYFVVAVDEAALEGWPSTTLLEPLSRGAQRITVRDREERVLNLQVRPR